MVLSSSFQFLSYHPKYFVYIFSVKILLFISRKFCCIIYLIIRFSSLGLETFINCLLVNFFFYCCAGWNTLWSLQRFLQYVKYIVLELTPSTSEFLFSPHFHVFVFIVGKFL
jgi:hypothetical protein